MKIKFLSYSFLFIIFCGFGGFGSSGWSNSGRPNVSLACNPVTDQSFLSSNQDDDIYDVNGDTNAMSFQVSRAGRLHSIRVRLDLNGTPTPVARIDDDLDASVEFMEQIDLSGLADDVLSEALATDTTLLVPGVTYYLFIRNDQASFSNRVEWYNESSGGYPNGNGYFNGDAWVVSTNDSRDFVFQIDLCT